MQRYTYRLFLIIFHSWKLYEVRVLVGVLKVSSTLKNIMAFAGMINLRIFIGPKIKMLICCSYGSECFRKEKGMPVKQWPNLVCT